MYNTDSYYWIVHPQRSSPDVVRFVVKTSFELCLNVSVLYCANISIIRWKGGREFGFSSQQSCSNNCNLASIMIRGKQMWNELRSKKTTNSNREQERMRPFMEALVSCIRTDISRYVGSIPHVRCFPYGI
jgi:hypothetical protein